MKNLFIVENDEKYLNMLKQLLEISNYNVLTFDNPLDAIEALNTVKCDLIITEIKLGIVDGFQLIGMARKIVPDLMFLVLTSSSEENDELKALDVRVNDFIKKPFSVDIFLKRIEILLSNISDFEEEVLISPIEEIELDIYRRSVEHKEKKIYLTEKEFDILEYFLLNKNTILTREMLVKNVWKMVMGRVEPRVVDTHITRLRKKLKLSSIQSIRGIGYRWNE